MKLFAKGFVIGVVFTILFILLVGKPSPKSNKSYKAQVTAYCPCEKCCGKYADGITASGYKLRKGNKLCAASFDFCTVLKIPGYGIVPVLDRIGDGKNNHIDVYFDSHEEALEWGIQYLEVEILK